MTDTSDGVLESAHLIAEASRTKLLLDPETLPLDPELRRRVRSPTERLRVAGFGGDYELFATMDPQRLLEARRALGRLRCPLTVIGSVRSGRGAFWQGARGESPLPLAGWDPFRTGSAALRR
jgi:thiamine monophosphate kinase